MERVLAAVAVVGVEGAIGEKILEVGEANPDPDADPDPDPEPQPEPEPEVRWFCGPLAVVETMLFDLSMRRLVPTVPKEASSMGGLAGDTTSRLLALLGPAPS